MRTSSIQSLPLVGLAVLTCAAGIASAGTVAVPIVRRQHPDPAKSPRASLVRRDGTLDLAALNNVTGGGYFAEFGIGTPPQNLSFQLDTGSSDTWMNSVEANLCQSQTLQLQAGFCTKQFNPDNSSTFNNISTVFDISYLDGRKIKGDYFKDVVSIDGVSIKEQQLGLALDSVRFTGIMGLGFSANTVAPTKYATVVDTMVAQGLIKSPAFSLYLNDLDASEGTILFGGVDTAKYEGDLIRMPMRAMAKTGSQDITAFVVDVEGISVKGVDGAGNFKGRALLDSGATVTLLPKTMAQKLRTHFNVITIPNLQPTFVDCSLATKYKDVTLDFKFAGTTIRVPVDELIINSFAGLQDVIRDEPLLDSMFDGWESVCLFGVASAAEYGITSDEFALFGDTFLRSAYVVYDMENKQIALAQAKHNVTETNIQEFTADTSTVPGSKDKEATASGNLNPPYRVAVAGTLILTVASIMMML